MSNTVNENDPTVETTPVEEVVDMDAVIEEEASDSEITDKDKTEVAE